MLVSLTRLGLVLGGAAALAATDEPLFPDGSAAAGLAASALSEVVVLSSEPLQRPLIGPAPEFVRNPQGGPAEFLVRDRQTGIRIEEPAWLTPGATASWTWRKAEGSVCIVQFELLNPLTGQRRYLGYGAGALAEEPSPDPTVEVFVAGALPQAGARVERRLFDDMKRVLGWERARLLTVYLSPWDGRPGFFSDLVVRQVAAAEPAARDLSSLSRIGTGQYAPSRLPDPGAPPVERFDTSFEECAPGRNSNANEWSAFGAIGDRDFNCLGREMLIRYPLYELAFRVLDGGRETEPGSLESFRLGLVDNRLPAVWGGWRHGGLLYKVSVMTVPEGAEGRFDLYKLQVQNGTDTPQASRLAAVVEGPPDLRLVQGVVRGLGTVPFLLADAPSGTRLELRDWGLCDKRAKAYAAGPGPGTTEPAVSTYRAGLDGLPVVYRVKAAAGSNFTVCLVSTPHASGYWLETPRQAGDLVWEYRVEGAPAQTLDALEYLRQKHQPFYVRFDRAHDADGDGYLEIRAGVAAQSRLRHSRLSVIYVFPEGIGIPGPEAVYSGSMNDRCVWHIDVGATPEQGPQNQSYDKSDTGLARLRLVYGATIPPHATATYWLKVPPIHRREPVSMGYAAHAFREVLPGEAVPPFPETRVQSLRVASAVDAERSVSAFWGRFFARAASLRLPDPVLNDLFLSRLATRAILDVQLAPEVVYNACSPFFYFDHAYRDQSYVVLANDLAGLHDRAARLLRAYCLDVGQIAVQGPIAFDGKPLQLGMLENGLWLTRPGQYDTQGQNLWALVQHYKLSGDRDWLERIAYPYIRRGALWLVNSRRRHMAEVGDRRDPRHGLIEPGGMEVMEVGKGMHMYYMNAFAILGLREAADAAGSLGRPADREVFAREAEELKASLHASLERTFKRTGLYDGHLWFGVEPEGVGMYGFWAHCCLLWPCRALEPQDPLLTATWRRLDRMSRDWGGGLFSEGPGSYWPYIGVDWAISQMLRGEPDRALDYFCAYVDKAGGTLSWGEGYSGTLAAGDQPHFWADAQYVNLLRHLFLLEDGATLHLTPALFRRWHRGASPIQVRSLPSHFGDVDLAVQPTPAGDRVAYRLALRPKGDQARRALARIVLHPRLAEGRPVTGVTIDGQASSAFTDDTVVLPKPPRGKPIDIVVRSDR